jgi:predicted peptidase
MGAEGVFKLLMDFPTRFAAAVAAGGYTLDKGASAMAQTPFWILHGSADSINLVASVRTIHQSILDAGGTKIRYTEYPGLDHMPAIEKGRSEPGLFEWLFAQSRASDLAQGRP